MWYLFSISKMFFSFVCETYQRWAYMPYTMNSPNVRFRKGHGKQIDMCRHSISDKPLCTLFHVSKEIKVVSRRSWSWTRCKINVPVKNKVREWKRKSINRHAGHKWLSYEIIIILLHAEIIRNDRSIICIKRYASMAGNFNRYRYKCSINCNCINRIHISE